MKNIKFVFVLSTVMLLFPLNILVAAEADYMMLPPQTADSIPADIYLDSLARLPEVQRGDLDEVGRAAFDTWVAPGTGYDNGLRGPIGMFMHSPVLAESIFDLRHRVRYGNAKDQRLTELAIITHAREFNSQYEYSAHEPLAVAAGLEQEIIDLVRYRKDLDTLPAIEGFGETEQTIVHFVRELVSEDKVSAETFARALDIFGEEGVMDLTGLVGYYFFVATTLKAFDVQRPIGAELLLPVLQD